MRWRAAADPVAALYFLLVGVGLVGAGFKVLSGGADGAERIFSFATDPVLGVILGILGTTLVQSSSTVTSVIVGLVAGGLPVAVAVPMVMGANMGTTVTNTIVSLGNLREGSAFRRSFAAATVHDFFNLLSIIIFLPLEVAFHPLERLAGAAAAILPGGAGPGGFNPVDVVTRPAVDGILEVAGLLGGKVGGGVAVAAGIFLVVGAVVRLGAVLKRNMTARAVRLVDGALGRGPFAAILTGLAVTVLVQSSSTTTSLVVPLAGAGVLTLRQVYPFTLGANVGTCVTALLAATAVAGDLRIFALQIALVHLIYNLAGVTLFTAVPWVRDLPSRLAEGLAGRTARRRAWALGYVVGVFFVLPGAVLGGQALRRTAPAPDPAAEAALDRAEHAVEDAGMSVE